MSESIRKSLLQFIFSGAYLLRWNDKLRPVEMTEIDKQAHKMLIACVLWHLHCQHSPKTDATALARDIIEGGLSDYFYRIVITDIKPPVFYRIRENADDYAKLTDFVLAQLETCFVPSENPSENSFWQRLCAWQRNPEENTLARRILNASHLFASQWEFSLIRPFNAFDDEMDDIAKSFSESLEPYSDLDGMTALRTPGTALARFANLCGQLRFQIRWTRLPRIPKTAVLGHMFLVAAFSYFFSLSINACQSRCNNNFFSGLFHDLPEVLTRDIISPVKRSVPNMPSIIKKYESDSLERRLFEQLREENCHSLVDLISFYLGIPIGSEFSECYRGQDGVVHSISDFDTLHTYYNSDEYTPKDGILIKVCDWLAAFLETENSIRTGVSSPQLVEARFKLKSLLHDKNVPPCLKLDTLLADFD